MNNQTSLNMNGGVGMEIFPLGGISDWVIWLILAIFFIILEVSTVNLITIWFALGSIIAMGFALIGLGIGWQIAAFIVISIASITLFLFFKGKLNLSTKTIEKTNADRNIGAIGIVTQRIDDLQAVGQVKVNGQIWSAVSIGGEFLEEGVEIEVVEIRGVKLYVKPKIV